MRKVMFSLMVLICLGLSGCDSGIVTGMGIGAGTSEIVTEAQRLAAESKAVLVSEILLLREEIADANALPADILILEADLASKETRLKIAENTERILNKAAEGLLKDWVSKDPQTQQENIRWAIDAVLLGLLGWQTRKRKIVEKGVAKFSAEAEPDLAAKLFADTKKYAGKLLP